MTSRTARSFARRIARSLFTNGAGQRAERLMLELPGGKDGGAWSERAAVDHIARVLQAKGKSA